MAQIQLENMTEFELAELNGNNGALLVLEDGLYFQKYLPAKDAFSYFGKEIGDGFTLIKGLRSGLTNGTGSALDLIQFEICSGCCSMIFLVVTC